RPRRRRLRTAHGGGDRPRRGVHAAFGLVRAFCITSVPHRRPPSPSTGEPRCDGVLRGPPGRLLLAPLCHTTGPKPRDSRGVARAHWVAPPNRGGGAWWGRRPVTQPKGSRSRAQARKEA